MADLVQIPELDDEVTRLRNEFKAAVPSWSNTDGSPLTYALAILVQQRILNYGLLNTSADRLFVATATGADLDRAMADYLLYRRVGESDADFRARLSDAFNQLNKDSPEAANVRARQVAGVSDARIDLESATGRNSNLYIQGPNYTNPTTELRTAVQAHLNDYSWAPWFATFAVPDGAANRLSYNITGSGANAGVWFDSKTHQSADIIRAVNEKLTETELQLRRFAKRVSPFDYESALATIPGVVRSRLSFSGPATTQTWASTSNSAAILHPRDRYVYVGNVIKVTDLDADTTAGRINIHPEA